MAVLVIFVKLIKFFLITSPNLANDVMIVTLMHRCAWMLKLTKISMRNAIKIGQRATQSQLLRQAAPKV